MLPFQLHNYPAQCFKFHFISPNEGCITHCTHLSFWFYFWNFYSFEHKNFGHILNVLMNVFLAQLLLNRCSELDNNLLMIRRTQQYFFFKLERKNCIAMLKTQALFVTVCLIILNNYGLKLRIQELDLVTFNMASKW